MRKRKMITVFAVMLAAVMPAALAGCSATVTNTNPEPESVAESCSRKQRNYCSHRKQCRRILRCRKPHRGIQRSREQCS